MQVNRTSEIMTKDPSCCTPDASLNDVARQMVDHDCGAIPVVDSHGDGKPIGIITDRDIVVRAVAKTDDLSGFTVEECMSSPCITVKEGASIDEACRMMKDNQIRRIVVVNEDGAVTGILAQADIARNAEMESTADLTRGVSRPSRAAA